MTQPNGITLSKTRSFEEVDRDHSHKNHAVGTRSVFQNLLDNVKALSKDPLFSSILVSMEKVPAMEDEIRQLREEEKLSKKSQRQLLEAFNQDRDGLRAEHERLQEQNAGLQEDIMRKEESAKAQEAARKQQADQIQALRKSEGTVKDDLSRSHKQVQGLVKAIEAEKQKCRSLQSSIDAQKAELTNTGAELQQLSKMHQTLQHKAEWDAKELQTIATLSIPLIEESPSLQPFNTLWFKMASKITSTFLKDVSFEGFKIDTFCSRLDRLGRWNKDLPLSESNSPAAKEMRSVAILASMSRIFVRQLFRPSYLLSVDSGLQEALYRQAKTHSAKESRLRATILALLPEEQEAAVTDAVATTCTEVSDLTNGLLSSADAVDFADWVKEIAEEACEIWQDVCRYSDSVRPDFTLKDDEDYIWDQMFFEERSPVFSGFGQIQDHDHDAVMFAIFPRLYSSFEGEEYPETHGVLFTTSHAQIARKEERVAKISKPKRSDSVRAKLLKGRRPSARQTSTQVGNEPFRDALAA